MKLWTIIFAILIFLLGMLVGHVQTVMSYDHVPHKWKDPKLFEMTKGEVRAYLGPPSHKTKFLNGDVWKQDAGPFGYFLRVHYEKKDPRKDFVVPPDSARVDSIIVRSRLYESRENEVFTPLPDYCYEVSLSCLDPWIIPYVLRLISDLLGTQATNPSRST